MNNLTKQRYISSSIWSDDWFDELSEREKLVYFYLLTNEHTNAAGVYPCTLKNVRLELGLNREEIEAIMAKFAQAGKAFYYKEYIIIPKWLKHQKVSDRSRMFLGAVTVLRQLPDAVKIFISEREHYDFDVQKYIHIHTETTADNPAVACPETDENTDSTHADAESPSDTMQQKPDSLYRKCSRKPIGYTENAAEIVYPIPKMQQKPDSLYEKCSKNRDDSDSDSDSKFSGGGGGFALAQAESQICEESAEPPPQPLNSPPPPNFSSVIKNLVKDAGFFIDDRVAANIGNAIQNREWFSGPTNIVFFAAQKIRAEYPGKPLPEQKRLFCAALCSWQNIRDEYLAWLENQNAAVKKQKSQPQEKPPENCPKCGAKLNGLDCDNCDGRVIFDNAKKIWVYEKRSPSKLTENFNNSLRSEKQKISGRINNYPPNENKPPTAGIEF